MEDVYNHKEIEERWQEEWAHRGVFKTRDSKKDKYFLLVEFPYPSGNLHIGHWYAFAVPDILARKKRMEGKNVLFPIGFDSFGLPAENAAIKHGVDPQAWTDENIEKMRNQLHSMGASFDTQREIATSNKEFYKWTQWLFLKFFERGLVGRKSGVVNWDPVDKTVLANEQVLSDGTAERSGAKVEKKELEQWYLKTTAYAEKLLDGLDDLNWPVEIKEAQRNWIGKKEGAIIDFRILESGERVEVFTTRADTIFGATFLAISPEHPLTKKLIERAKNKDVTKKYIEDVSKIGELERTKEHRAKTGVQLEGIYAKNPATGGNVPVWVADYVLAGYGTGAVMGVPAHDARDYEFAKMFELPIQNVIEHNNGEREGVPYEGEGLLIHSGRLTGLSSEDGREKAEEMFGARKITFYKMRDWLVSRQRYWGCPIPIVYDPKGNPHSVPEKHLPWVLPTDVDFKPTGRSPLATSKELLSRTEKIFGKGWTPEADTLDVFVDSSWYFLRFLDPNNSKQFASRELMNAWMPVNFYSGGAEHTTVHLLYSRFFYKALFDMNLVPTAEPYKKRMNRGLILGEDGRKMSKRWGNVIDPDLQVKRFGADAVRLYLGFIGPFNEAGSYPWDTGGLVGMKRFLEKVWRLSKKRTDKKIGRHEALLHQTIRKVGEDVDALKFNTALSQLMILASSLEKDNYVEDETYKILLKLLHPFAPHLTDELWQSSSYGKNLLIEEAWPTFNEEKVQTAVTKVAIQYNGKTKGVIDLPHNANKEEAIAEALKLPFFSRIVTEDTKKVVYIPQKIINFVTKG